MKERNKRGEREEQHTNSGNIYFSCSCCNCVYISSSCVVYAVFTYEAIEGIHRRNEKPRGFYLLARAKPNVDPYVRDAPINTSY